MNLDAVARLIEGSSFTEFRTICNKFLQLIGLQSATYCDGPYDGGTDFSLEKQGELRPAVQISVESDWRKKIQKDVQKLKTKYNSNLVYFLSSRRIPEGSFEEVKGSILNAEQVVVVRHDNQAMATVFIKEGEVEFLLNILGIDVGQLVRGNQGKLGKYKGPSSEVVSSFLIFGDEAKDLRKHVFGSLIKAELGKSTAPTKRRDLIERVVSSNSLSVNQEGLVGAHIDRLIQAGEMVSHPDGLVLSFEEQKKFKSLEQITEYEIASILKAVDLYLKEQHVDLNEESREIIVSNFIDLAICLVVNQFSMDDGGKELELYHNIKGYLHEKIGDKESTKLLTGLAEIVASSDFSKQVVAAKLYTTILNASSDQVALALGGRGGVMVFFDSSVLIPMLCGLVFKPAVDRSGNSARLLFELMGEHHFSGVVPVVYVEEVAAHLIEACRDYAAILQEGEGIHGSDNAFVSHFSSCREREGITFEEYVMTFGVRLEKIKPDMSDALFYTIRDKAMIEITSLLERYSLEVAETRQFTASALKRVYGALEVAGIGRPEVLVKHDAAVVSSLSGNQFPSDQAKILCTWDKIHHDVNPDGDWGYIVMNPFATIDLFAIAKGKHTNYPLSTLLDFMKIQTEDSRALADKIWDSIASYEKGGLSDARLLSMARKFKEKFLDEKAEAKEIAPEDISKAWMAWKNSH